MLTTTLKHRSQLKSVLVDGFNVSLRAVKTGCQQLDRTVKSVCFSARVFMGETGNDLKSDAPVKSAAT